jgi:hypothetical protein
MKNKIVYISYLMVTYSDADETRTVTMSSQEAVMREIARLLDNGYDIVSSGDHNMTLRFDPTKNRPMVVNK